MTVPAGTASKIAVISSTITGSCSKLVTAPSPGGRRFSCCSYRFGSQISMRSSAPSTVTRAWDSMAAVGTQSRVEENASLLVDTCDYDRRCEYTLFCSRDLAGLDPIDHLLRFDMEHVGTHNSNAPVVAVREVALFTDRAAKRGRQRNSSPLVELTLVHTDKHSSDRSLPENHGRLSPTALNNAPIFPHRQPFGPTSLP